MRSAKRPNGRSGSPSQVRIIGGRLRGSKLPVLDAPGLRPSPDRLRETLYNWLGPAVVGARVLDLYAGSGALGIEAASRGAASVRLIERDRRLADSLRAQLQRLHLSDPATAGGCRVELLQADALSVLQQGSERPFDLILIDPPFAGDLWAATLAALGQGGWLGSDSLIYLESPVGTPLALPEGWTIRRQSRVGEVSGQLCERAL